MAEPSNNQNVDMERAQRFWNCFHDFFASKGLTPDQNAANDAYYLVMDEIFSKPDSEYLKYEKTAIDRYEEFGQYITSLKEKYGEDYKSKLDEKEAYELNLREKLTDVSVRNASHASEVLCESKGYDVEKGVYREALKEALMLTSPAMDKANGILQKALTEQQEAEMQNNYEPEIDPETGKPITVAENSHKQQIGELSSPLKQLSSGQGNYLA